MTKKLGNPGITAPNISNTCFLVLCGGAGTRMAGKDKPLMNWRGQPMVDHVLDSVPPNMQRWISANRNHQTYAQRARVLNDASVLADPNIKPGPLVGVMSGLRALNSEPRQQWLLVSPGDTPQLDRQWWPTMQQTAEATHAPVVVAFDGTRQQHLHLLLHQTLEPHLLSYLQAGERSAYGWLGTLEVKQATFTTAGSFHNINAPKDLSP